MKKILLPVLIMLMATSFIYADGTAVVYFSATGNTERVARMIAEETDEMQTSSKSFRLIPTQERISTGGMKAQESGMNTGPTPT